MITTTTAQRASIHPGRIRQLWSLVDETHSHLLHELSDSELTSQLLETLSHQYGLNREEKLAISGYLQMRIPLIRDLA
jgi:hypothetical protein